MRLEEAAGLGGLVCERNASTSKSRLGIAVRKCPIGAVPALAPPAGWRPKALTPS